jgi:hypothetical protein
VVPITSEVPRVTPEVSQISVTEDLRMSTPTFAILRNPATEESEMSLLILESDHLKVQASNIEFGGRRTEGSSTELGGKRIENIDFGDKGKKFAYRV